MQLLDLIALFRSEADDLSEPYLWPDSDLRDYANDAQNEACRRARLLVDGNNTDVVGYEIMAGQSVVVLDPRVLFVRRARFDGKAPLRRMTMQDMDALNPLWENAPPGTPRCYITDFETGSLLLWPRAEAATYLYLLVVRDPLQQMVEDQDSPEIAARYHRSLVFWMLFRAYNKQDSEANDPKKALNSLALFEQEFGKKSAAIDEMWITREQIDGDGTF
jgi:hypothetical protein